jgi:excisionase family DNA binding protein
MNTIELNLIGLDEIMSRLEVISSKLEEIQNQKSLKRWLSNPEACDFLGVTLRTMQNYRDNGLISFSKVGSKIYYKLSDLETHLEANFFEAFNTGRRVS